MRRSPRSRRLASSTSSVICVEPRALRADHLQQLVTPLGRERDVVAQERLRRAEHGRHRRAQLVGERGDEVALRRLEPALDGQVAEGVDDAVRAADGDEREPQLTAVHLDRQRHRAGELGLLGDRDLGGDRLPAREAPRRPGGRPPRRASAR